MFADKLKILFVTLFATTKKPRKSPEHLTMRNICMQKTKWITISFMNSKHARRRLMRFEHCICICVIFSDHNPYQNQPSSQGKNKKLFFDPSQTAQHTNESSQDIQQIQLDFHSFSCFLFSSLHSHNIACSSMHSWESGRRRGDDESVGFDGAATTTTKKLVCCFLCCVWWGIHRESNESSGKLKDDGTWRDDEQ